MHLDSSLDFSIPGDTTNTVENGLELVANVPEFSPAIYQYLRSVEVGFIKISWVLCLA